MASAAPPPPPGFGPKLFTAQRPTKQVACKKLNQKPQALGSQ